jgi:hypothetical protein
VTGLTGQAAAASIPASWGSESTEQMTTGISRVSARDFRPVRNAQPSSRGIITSREITVGRLRWISARAVSPYILLPLAIPSIVVVVIREFTSIWSEFLFAVVLANKADVQPITVAPNNLAGSRIVEWNVRMAGALMAALPTLLIYILLGRYYLRGLLAGALMG